MKSDFDSKPGESKIQALSILTTWSQTEILSY
nr:hypothetical protein ELOWGMBK_ELOWGMBK_CDS_0014 [Herelleviridae sp.]CAI9751964.1 hypothetical protein QGKEIAJE_QGKEIAJE_CDS_0013 [uncultured phage]